MQEGWGGARPSAFLINSQATPTFLRLHCKGSKRTTHKNSGEEGIYDETQDGAMEDFRAESSSGAPVRGCSASICSEEQPSQGTNSEEAGASSGKSRHSDEAALDEWGTELRTCKRSLTLKNNNKDVAYLPLELWEIGR